MLDMAYPEADVVVIQMDTKYGVYSRSTQYMGDYLMERDCNSAAFTESEDIMLGYTAI